MIPIPNHPDVSVLNCGAGDMKFSFDPKDPLEVARASRVVKDMLARGYMLFAMTEGKLVRVKKFDAETGEYVLADGPDVAPAPNPPAEAVDEPEPVKPAGKRGGYKSRRVPAHKTPVTGIAPTAGG